MAERTVEGIRLDLSGLQILPGLINAHDHLQFAIFPMLGSPPYPNAGAWARDIYRPDEEPLASLRRVPKELRLLWGGLRNLVCGVTAVHHHDPWHECFENDFPVRVIRAGWAHSLEYTPDVAKEFAATPPGLPFVIHLAEGTDEPAALEVFRLHELGALTDRTVLVHAIGITEAGWRLVADAGASAIWCPQSNQFLFGRTLDPAAIPPEVKVAIGSDSPISARGDLLDHLQGVPAELVCRAAEIFRLPLWEDWIATPAFGQPPHLVVRDGRMLLISPRLAEALPGPLREQFFPLNLKGRPPALVRWNTPRLLQATLEASGHKAIYLSNKLISVVS